MGLLNRLTLDWRRFMGEEWRDRERPEVAAFTLLRLLDGEDRRSVDGTESVDKFVSCDFLPSLRGDPMTAILFADLRVGRFFRQVPRSCNDDFLVGEVNIGDELTDSFNDGRASCGGLW